MAARLEDEQLAEEAPEEPGLCPACGAADIEDPRTGFCFECASTAWTDGYLQREAEEIAGRRREWAERVVWQGKASQRERQRRHRLIEAVMPKEAPPPGVDPWELAKQAIKLIREARERLSPTLRADYVDPAIELIRQLAWGPHPVTRPPRLKQAPGSRAAPG